MIVAPKHSISGGRHASSIRALCFTATRENSTVAMTSVFQDDSANGYRLPEIHLEYSTDGKRWHHFIEHLSVLSPSPTAPAITSPTITLANVGDKVYIRAMPNYLNSGTCAEKGIQAYYTFVLTGGVAASGDITALLDAVASVRAFSRPYVFARLFFSKGALTTPPELPTTTLSDHCYFQMFMYCTGLATAPALPAEVLETSCYEQMFSNCSSLVDPPQVFAARILASVCCWRMFSVCTHLERAPELLATELAPGCYAYMFSDCIRMTSAPVLNATTLVGNCYNRMFYNCQKLASLTTRQTTFDGNGPTEKWLYNVAVPGTLRCLPALGTDEAIERGASACPEGWTVEPID